MNTGPQKERTRYNALGFGILLLLSLVGYGFLFESGKTPHSNHSDVLPLHLGSKSVLHRARQRGEGIPLWRSDQLSGGPAFTHPQTLYTAPLHVFFWLLSPLQAIGPTYWLHFLVAALGCFVLGGALGLGFSARLVMGVGGLFVFKLILTAYGGGLVPLIATVMIPWLWAGLLYWLQEPSWQRGVVLGAVGGLSLHVGNPQIIYFAGVVGFFYILWHLASLRINKAQIPWKHLFSSMLLALFFALGGIAYLWWPMLGEASLLSRGESSYEFFLSGHSLKWGHLLTLLYPEAIGTLLDNSYPGSEMLEDVAYFGILPLFLAIIGGISIIRSRRGLFWLLAFVCSFILMADTPVLEWLFRYFPGLSLFRCPTRFTYFTIFLGLILAGLGVEWLASVWRARQKNEKIWALLLLLCIGGMSVEGMVYARRYLKMVPPSSILPKKELENTLKKLPRPARLATFRRTSFNYGWAGYLGVELISGYDPYNLNHYLDYFVLMETGRWKTYNKPVIWKDFSKVARWDLVDALQINYVLSYTEAPRFIRRLRKVQEWKAHPSFAFYRGFRDIPLYLYQNPGALPRAVWIDRVWPVMTLEDMRRAILQQDIRRQSIVLAEQDIPSAVLERKKSSAVRASGQRDAGIEWLRKSGGVLRLRLRTKAWRFLRLAEIWHPGWRALLNGKKHPLYRVDWALMGTWVPPGTHVLTVHFVPIGWPYAFWLSCFCWGLLLVLLVYISGVGKLLQKKKGQEGLVEV